MSSAPDFKRAAEVILAVAEAIREVGEIPSSHLYVNRIDKATKLPK